ncbi:hypothetical protein [Pseudomonas germanica]|uniref:Apolipoprotein A1/A4/E family protein n=1 Tax=Pseudomonas germanica TaxID=2815720 RepID=A0ABX8YIU6_9PSED|nr:hypothetical protein [Pseudomonas germanica]QYY79492.1 apolipoprotein A1/A4/E family protein [Pseudomonas germanica]
MRVPTDQIAFLAIAQSPKDKRRRIAVFVGVRAADPGESPPWRVRFVDAERIEKFFSAVEAGSIFDLEQDAGLIDDWVTSSRSICTSDGDGNDSEAVVGPATGAMKNCSFWLDGIIRVHFFQGDRLLDSSVVPKPLVHLDVAGSVVNLGGDVLDANWAVSRVRLDAVSAWIKQDGSFNLDSELKEFRLICHIPLALGVHKPPEPLEYKSKRYDTRALLVAHAVRDRQKAGRLWLDGEETKSARFRILDLGFSDLNGVTPQTLLSTDRIKSTAKDRTFDDLVGNNQAYFTAPAASSDAPAFSHIPLFCADPPDRLKSARRQIGFRKVMNASNNDSLQLILRAELDFEIVSRGVWTALWEGFAKAVTGLDVPKSLETRRSFSLAQEQYLNSLKLECNPPDIIHWLFTARFDQDATADLPLSQSIEGALVDLLGEMRASLDKPLRLLRPLSGATTVPDISVLRGDVMPWHVVGDLSEQPHRRRVHNEAYPPISWPDARDPDRSIILRSFQPRLSQDLWSIKPQKCSRRAKVELAAIRTKKGRALMLDGNSSMTLQAQRPEKDQWALQPSSSEEGLIFELSAMTADILQTLRIGSLEFDLQKLADITYVARLRSFTKGTAGLDSAGGMELILRLLAATVTPADQDPLPSMQRGGKGTKDDSSLEREPLLLAFNRHQDQTSPLLLTATEVFDAQTDQTVEWKVETTPGDHSFNPVTLLVLDPAPFRVVVAQSVFRYSDEGGVIADYRRQDDGNVAWRVVDPLETVNIMLGPQILGEAMEKSAQSTTGTQPQDIGQDQPAAARFGSLTRIALDQTNRSTNTREPGWNIRRLLNRVSDAAPGAMIRDLRLELAYGMVTRLIPTKDIWLAEMSGIIGAPPRKLTDSSSPHDKAIVDYGNDILAAPNYRLAVDKVWSAKPEADFETTDGLTFALRTKIDGAGPETPFRFPVSEGYDSTDDDDPSLNNTFAAPLAEDDLAFSGGIPWAFPSANILKEVYLNPLSHSGRLGAVHLSALGGWGRQRAEFADGKSIIETETDMGRMSFYKLERLGRIGGLGHRAKHVIVFRRTVVPSAQFYNRSPIGLKQDEHAGRPILRKVEEYVEILQPERRYPENGTAVREAGCLVGARFTSRRMLVDSDWGGDVRNEGWVVPLWQKTFAVPSPASGADSDSPASLYPKPVVHLLMPGEDNAEVAIEIATPERLVFYTSTLRNETSENVDQWHAVESVDFCDAPAPTVSEGKWSGATDRSKYLHDGMLPSAPREAKGHEAMTLELVDARVPVRLTAGRTEDGPASTLKNITLSRARPRQSTTPDPALPKDTDSEEHARLAGEQAAMLAATIRGRLDRMFGMVAGRFESLWREGMTSRERLIAAVNACRAALITDLKTLHEEIGDNVRELTDNISRAKVDQHTLTLKLSEDIQQKLEAEHQRLLGQCESIFRHEMDQLQASAQNLKQIRSEIDGVSTALKDVKVGQPVENAKKVLTEWISKAETLSKKISLIPTALPEAYAVLEVNGEGIDRALGIQAKIESLREEILREITIFKSALSEVGSSIDNWQEPLDEPALNDFKHKIRSSLGVQQETIERIQSGLKNLAKSDGIVMAMQSMARQASTLCDALENQLVNFSVQIEAVSYPVGPDVKKALQSLCKTMDTRTQTLSNILKTNLANAANDLYRACSQLLGELKGEQWSRDLITTVAVLAKSLAKALQTIRSSAQALLDATGNVTVEIEALAHTFANTVLSEFQHAIDTVPSRIIEARERAELALSTNIAPLNKNVITAIDEALKPAKALFDRTATACTEPANGWNKWADQLKSQIADISESETHAALEIERRINQFADDLIKAIRADDTLEAIREKIADAVNDQVERIRKGVDGVLGDVNTQLARTLGVQPGELVNGVRTAVEDARYLYQEGDNVLRLLRAVGDPPKTDGLGLNRPEVAYVFDALKPIVDMTPAIAFANKVNDTVAAAGEAGRALGDLAEAFGLRNPVEGLGSDFIPESLKGLSISKLFPSMGGLDLEGLLKDAVFPDLATQKGQGVPITRGFDKNTKEAWLQADIDVKLDKSTAILDFGPVSLMLDKGHFTAMTRVSRGLGGETATVTNGQIKGDWRLVTGGMEVITFEQTPLLFDKSGRIDFKIATERVRLAPSLEFLTNLMAKAKQAVPSGVEPIMRDGAPAGLVARLAMALPPIQTGVFGITDLTFGASFAVIAVPEFEIQTSLDIGSRDAPFTLAVWLLNGGGYISQHLSYRPMAKPTPVLSYTLDVSICAGVGIGFGFGVVSGGVWLQVGCSIALTWTTGCGGNVTTLTAFMLARGSVDVAGLVTAGIMLRLELSYDGSEMIARGTLRLSFRISCFYTLKVNQAAEYHIAGERRAEQASDYAASFG